MSDPTGIEEQNIEKDNTKITSGRNLKVKRRKLAPELPEEEHNGSPAVNDEDSLFFDVPKEDPEEEPVFGELIFGEQITGRKVEVKLKPDREPESEEEYIPEEEEPEEQVKGNVRKARRRKLKEQDPEELQKAEQKQKEAEQKLKEQEELEKQQLREKRKAELKKELEEQLKKEKEEKEEQKSLEAQVLKEKERLEAKARKEQAKQEAKAKKEQAKQEAKLRREQIKQTAEYRRRLKIRRILILAAVVVVLVLAAVFLINRYVRLSHYSVVSSFEMTNIDENSEIFKFHDGYIKCAGDGVTYFDNNGIIWNESLSMADPLCDVCGDYIAVTDMKSTEVYIYGPSGFINKFSLTRVATDVEVSRYGTVAVSTNEGDSNYVELKDHTGADLATVKTVFSSTGYLADISLSADGSKLAAAYIQVADGNIESKVIFYDFSKDSNQGENVTIGEFDQYKSTLLTTVEFMDGNRLAAVGDNAFTIYSVGNNPEIIYEELNYPWQINSLFINGSNIGFIVENDEGEDAYAIKAYNLNGKLVCDNTFDFAYNHVDFAGNAVLLYSDYDCDVFNFAGTHKFSYSFDSRLFTLSSCGDSINYILLSQGQTQFIKLN